MNIVNASLSTGLTRPLSEKPLAQNQRDQLPARRPSNEAPPEIDQQALAQKESQLAQNRVQKLNASESGAFKAQQALNTYQQTETFAKQFEQGELVGVDLFV